MAGSTTLWRHQDGAWPNLLASAYVLLASLLGIALMAVNAWLWLPGVLLTAHAMVVGGYLIHELAHQNVFSSKRLNFAAGECLSWLCGAAYAPFSRIHKMHIRHHGDRADLTLFDPRAFLQNSPPWVRRLVYALEWCFIPAVELIMQYQVLVRPFVRDEFRRERKRVILVGLSRLAFFALLLALGLQVLIGYAIAFLLFLTALFVADAYAHTYEYYLVEQPDQPVPREGRDREYDKTHTYSNLISTRWPLLNLLNLNFGYHNAHHDQPATPWYRLPNAHRDSYPADTPQILPWRALWRSFHRNRVTRILAEDPGDIAPGNAPGRADHFLGVHGVSFLSIV